MPGSSSTLGLGYVDNFCHFDNGYHRMGVVSAGASCSIVSSPVYGGMARSMQCNTSLKGSAFVPSNEAVRDAETYYHMSFYYRVTSSAWPDPVNNYKWISSTDETAQNWYLKFETDGASGHVLKLYNTAGTLIGTSSANLITKDTWYHIRIAWQHKSSGTFILIVNSTVVFLLNSQNLTGGGSTSISYSLGAHRLAGFAGNTTAYYSKLVCLSGVASSSNPLGNGQYDIYTYKPGNTGTTPDCDETGATGSLDTLNTGNFDDASDYDTGTTLSYVGIKGGAVRCDDTNTYGDPAPSGSSDFDDNQYLIAGKWSWNLDNSSTVLTANIVFGYYDGSIHLVTSEDTGLVRNNKVYNKLRRWGERAERVPKFDEYFVIGLHADGLYTLTMREWACAVLTVDGEAPSEAGTKVQIQK